MEALFTLLFICLWAERPELWAPLYSAVSRVTPQVPLILDLNIKASDPARITGEVLDQLDAEIDRLNSEADLQMIQRAAHICTYVDRVYRCREALWRAVRDGRQGGVITTAINALLQLCVDDFFAGDWEETKTLAEEGIALCESLGYELLKWPFKLGQALVAAGRGELETTASLTGEMLGWATPRLVGGVQLFAWHARALAAIGQRNYEYAYEQVTLISPPGVFPTHVAYALWVPMDVVEAAVHTDRLAEASAHVSAMREANLSAISPRLALITVASEALATKDDDTAIDLFTEALAIPSIDRWAFEVARVRLAFGERLRRARAASQSRTHFSAALDTFERLEARPWVARARQELRATGVTTTGTSHAGADSLTPQEREIAMLAAAGLTNKQIGERLSLAHRTIGAHLYRIFPKLGISSRAALHEALQRDGSGVED
jgi:DNA-binding CsgD family transcriptional regulator